MTSDGQAVSQIRGVIGAWVEAIIRCDLDAGWQIVHEHHSFAQT